jgi:hypothetical protein
MSQDSDPFDEDYQVDDAEEAEDDHLIESSEDYAGEDSYHTAAGDPLIILWRTRP